MASKGRPSAMESKKPSPKKTQRKHAPKKPQLLTTMAKSGTSGQPQYDVFISYASEDRKDVVAPLTRVLKQRGITFWLDKIELTLGDSLRRNIDDGLRRSRFGVVVLSPSFFAKE